MSKRREREDTIAIVAIAVVIILAQLVLFGLKLFGADISWTETFMPFFIGTGLCLVFVAWWWIRLLILAWKYYWRIRDKG
jgi:phosphate/sulfate permease